MEKATNQGGWQIIMGDLNVQSVVWRNVQHVKGGLKEEWVSSRNLVVQNEWGLSTFVRGANSSVTDHFDNRYASKD